jgi:hypothetical protein
METSRSIRRVLAQVQSMRQEGFALGMRHSF